MCLLLHRLLVKSTDFVVCADRQFPCEFSGVYCLPFFAPSSSFFVTGNSSRMSSSDLERDIALFKTFLRFKTVHPTPDWEGCTKWLQQQAAEVGLTCTVHYFAPNIPLVVMSLQGSQPELPSVLLNCHVDVVPVVEDRWDALPAGETPFSAWESPDGKIYARGSQDMKCVGAGYLCALRRLRAKRKTLKRTIHLSWVPDEEIGGTNGMLPFSQSEEFRSLKVGVALDEGLAHPEDKFVVYYGERTGVWARFRAEGPVGHGSKLIPETAVERLMRAARRLSEIRAQNVAKLKADGKMRLGDVTTVNITVLQGGTSSDGGKTFAPNVIPSDATMICDIRIAHSDFSAMMQELFQLARENNLALDFTDGDCPETPSPINTAEAMEQWQGVIESSLKKFSPQEIEFTIFPAATDSKHVRERKVPAFGFSPMRRTPSLLHDHNEYLSRETFLEGVEVYEDLIQALANAC